MKQIEVRGDRVHNLKNIDVNVPLNKIVGIAGASGSGKSSLALGVLYAEGSRRYLESLSTYTRRRLTGPRGRRWRKSCMYLPHTAKRLMDLGLGYPGSRQEVFMLHLDYTRRLITGF